LKEYAESLFQGHAQNGVILDTNLLLLLIFGSARRELVGSYKRLNMFVVEDFDALVTIVSRFRTVATTPNILTEVSNLAASVADKHKDEYVAEFAQEISVLDEQYVPSRHVLMSPALAAFGLSDAVIAEIATRDLLVLTIDAPLYQYLSGMGLPVLNFNHIRTMYWT
jgi:hypothetical protein